MAGTSNWRRLLFITAIAVLVGAAGLRMVWNAQKVMIAKREVYREIVSRKVETKERDKLMRQVAELKAATRMEVRARLMNLTVPDGDKVIVVEPGKDK